MQHSLTTFRERGKTEWDGGEAEVPLSVPPQLPNPHHYPTTPTEQEVRGGKKGGITLETQSHSHSCSFSSRPAI